MLPSTSTPQTPERKGITESNGRCDTCIQRHARCDKQKPACLTCVKSGRYCKGYSTPKVRRPRRLEPTFIIWRPKAPSLTQHRPRVAPTGDQEGRAFDYFRSKSAVKLSGWFDSGFWCRLVLQASHEEPIIQHAVTALGALLEAIQSPRTEAVPSKPGDISDRFALRQYNKAIGLLNRHLGLYGTPSTTTRSITIALLSSLLFIAFEGLRGNYEASLTHIQCGLSMFHTWEAGKDRPVPTDTSGDDRELVNMFSQLNLGALVEKYHFCPMDLLVQEEKQLSCVVPGSFTGLSEARDWMYNVCQSTMQNPILSRQTLSEWLSTFHAFVESSRIGIDHRDLQAAVLLELQAISSTIVPKLGLSPTQTDFDGFEAEFCSIVLLASSLIKDFEDATIRRGTAHFSFDQRVIAPLYLVASRCRDPWIRREALSLLSATHRQESVWDSKMWSRIAERIILIEEGVDDINQVRISKSSEVRTRVSIAQTTIYSEERKVLVKLLRTTTGSGEQSIQHELITY